jgi:AcrR family transcriptional regulator
MGERRDAKKLETRQRISDEATALFLAHGFEAVTLDDVAAAAKVSKMTVFNYFARKEDLMLDRQDDLRLALLADAIRARPPGQSPAAALRLLLKDLRAQGHPFTRVDRTTLDWWQFVATSPSLCGRLRELADEAAEGLAAALGEPHPDARAHLAAGVVVLTVRTARDESLRAYTRGASEAEAADAFFAAFDIGLETVDHLTDGR